MFENNIKKVRFASNLPTQNKSEVQITILYRKKKIVKRNMWYKLRRSGYSKEEAYWTIHKYI